MAEFGAHLTNSQISYDSDNNSNIFELLAQESLSSGLRKAANLVIKILYQNNGQPFNRLYKNFDELYLLFDICVQFCHLRAYNSSFSENFYCLKRISSDLLRKDSKLNFRQFYSSLIVLTIFPYIKSKCDSLYLKLKYKYLELGINSLSTPNLIFLKTYPTFCSTYELLKLYYQMSYSVGKNQYHSPLLQVSNVRLCNLTDNDLRDRNSDFEILDKKLDWFQYFRRLSWLSTKWMANGLGVGLSVGAFFIQFLDYWYSRESSSQSFAPLPIPPPPEKIDIEIPLETCPICLQPRNNDTALLTSGFVFCYSCIKNYVSNKKRCPVTGYPSSHEHLIKIYPPDS